MPPTIAHDVHEEEAEGKAYDHDLMVRLLGYLKPYRAWVFVSVFALLAVAGLELLGPILTKIAIDRYIASGDYGGLARIAAIFVGVLILAFGLRYGEILLMNLTGQKAMYDLRREIFHHLQGLSTRFFNRNPVGRLMTRLTGDVDVLNQLFTSGVVALVEDMVKLLGILVVMLALDWRLALVTMTVMPLIFTAAMLFRRRVRSAFRQTRLKIARINAYLQENITGMRVVQLFNRERKSFEKFDRLNFEHLDAFLRTIFYFATFFPLIQLLGAVSISLIIWYGGGRVLEGVLTFGTLVAFTQYAQMFFQPIGDMAEKYNMLQQAMASSERIFHLLETRDEVPDGTARLEDVRGHVVFEDVQFQYVEDEPVIRGVSFEVKPGEKVAVVGATGAGKTTLTALLTRLHDVDRGRILLDGHDLREIRKQDLRRAIGVVQQDVFLFSGTVEDNITLGDRRIPPEKVVEVARRVNAHGFISRLPNEYDEEVRERGGNFSSGQKQLLSFARALAYDPALLILDEATSSVDTETELLIQDALEKLMEGRTSIVIAHRLSTIQRADRILVMHKGQIREEGTHAELLAAGDIYTRLYQLQYKDQEVRKAG
jgi:ATP-binding cassette subfamily B multidrug efflux pump